jgi:hypothetical protein
MLNAGFKTFKDQFDKFLLLSSARQEASFPSKKLYTPEIVISRIDVTMHKKLNLPSKTCLVCGRPFTWRKKWEKVWEEVKYCSDKCRKNKSAT